MGIKEDLVRQRLAEEQRQRELADQESAARAAEERKAAQVKLEKLIAKIHVEIKRITKLFEQADWSKAELGEWVFWEGRKPRYFLVAMRLKTRRVVRELAWLPVGSEHIALRSDGQLYVWSYHRGWVSLLDDIDRNGVVYVEGELLYAEDVLRVLRRCTKPPT